MVNQSMSHCSIIGIAVIALLAAPPKTTAQFEQIVSQTYPRPMDKVLRIIEARCDCVITYEDPQYDARHVVDVTATARRDGKSEPKVWGLRPSFFSFLYDVSAMTVERDAVAREIESAVAQFNATRTDDVAFRLIQTPTVFHVIPAQGSILRTRVKVTKKEGRADQVIDAILTEVTRAHGKPIHLAGMHNALMNNQARLTVDVGSADKMILRILHTISPKLSWRLLFGFGEQFYVLGVSDSSRPPRQIIEHP
jgi:hypothetical protein